MHRALIAASLFSAALAAPPAGAATPPPPAWEYQFPSDSSLGRHPKGELTVGANNWLYGTTRAYGPGALTGSPAAGTVYRLQPTADIHLASPKVELLHAFTGPDGAQPYQSPIFVKGSLYGTTAYGGQYNKGVLYKLTPPAVSGTQWAYTKLYDFPGGSEGETPFGRLFADGGGNLYGTTYAGGWGNGTVWVATLASNYAPVTVARFTATFNPTKRLIIGDGINPVAGISRAPSGLFYLGTQAGGAYGYGAIMELDPSANLTDPWTTSRSVNLKQPKGSSIISNLTAYKGAFYGTTLYGGTAGVGVAFRFHPGPTGQPGSYTVIAQFPGQPRDAHPYGALAVSSAGVLYGASETGGDGNPYDSTGNGAGTVFSLTPPAPGGSWTYTTLFSVNGTGKVFSYGSYPEGGLVFGADGRLYGTLTEEYFADLNAGILFAFQP